MKKTFVLFCITAFLFGLASCGEESTKGNRFEGDKMVISVTGWEVGQSFGSKPDELYQYIQDRFGVVFEPHEVGWDNSDQMALLWAQAGTLPDVIGGMDFINTATFKDWIEAGIIRTLPDDLSAYPTLNALINQPYVQGRAVDGEIYFIPRISMLKPEWDVTVRGIINRRDWREKLGIPVPRTEEDFLNMWRAFVNPANNINGTGAPVFGVLPDPLVASVSDRYFAGHGDTGSGWIMQPDGSMVKPALEPTSLPLMSYLRGAYKEGLMDPDFLTDSSRSRDGAMQKFAQGNVGTLLRQIAPVHLNLLYTQWVVWNPDVDFENAVEILMPPMLPGVTPIFSMGNGFWSETYINANVDDEKLEKILQIYEWLNSEEGINMIMFGFEGKDWELRGGEITMLTSIDPTTGLNLRARDLYQFAAGGMRNLAVWAEDLVQWTDPGIPFGVREMSIEARDRMLGPGMGLSQQDPRIQPIVLEVPEASRMTLRVGDEWNAFISDTSNISNEELLAQFQARWKAAGYDEAKAALTREVAARGLTY